MQNVVWALYLLVLLAAAACCIQALSATLGPGQEFADSQRGPTGPRGVDGYSAPDIEVELPLSVRLTTEVSDALETLVDSEVDLPDVTDGGGSGPRVIAHGRIFHEDVVVLQSATGWDCKVHRMQGPAIPEGGLGGGYMPKVRIELRKDQGEEIDLAESKNIFAVVRNAGARSLYLDKYDCDPNEFHIVCDMDASFRDDWMVGNRGQVVYYPVMNKAKLENVGSSPDGGYNSVHLTVYYVS